MARKRNPHETERRWRTLLTRLERSGQSVVEFAARHGVSTASVYHWRKRLGRSGPVRRRSPSGGPRASMDSQAARSNSLRLPTRNTASRSIPSIGRCFARQHRSAFGQEMQAVLTGSLRHSATTMSHTAGDLKSLLPDVWKRSHPEKVREFRAEDQRRVAERKR